MNLRSDSFCENESPPNLRAAPGTWTNMLVFLVQLSESLAREIIFDPF
jgi:hypothetical protein